MFSSYHHLSFATILLPHVDLRKIILKASIKILLYLTHDGVNVKSFILAHWAAKEILIQNTAYN
jgi:hypothetical protein